MQSPLQRTVLGWSALLIIVSAWLWVSAEDYNEYASAPEFTVPERFQHSAGNADTVDEDELPEYTSEPPPQHGWIVPPKPVRKAVGRVKSKIKKKNR